MTALGETEYIRIALLDFAKSLPVLKNIFFQKSVFTFIVESIIPFISFSKGPWELDKTTFFYLQPENLIYFDQIETKLTSEMEEEEPFIFSCFGPADAIVSGLLSYDDIREL